MFTISIEHAISDFPTWKQAFDRLAEARQEAGVLSHRIRHPVGDPSHLAIDLEFDAEENANNFHHFLRDVVWANMTPRRGSSASREPDSRSLLAATETVTRGAGT